VKKEHLQFSVQSGVQRIVAMVQKPLRAPATESTHEVDEDSEDPNYGVTRHFCPVALARDRVLRPGQPDLAVPHNNAFYHLATESNRAEFIAAPSRFLGLATAAPPLPPMRMLLAGATGAGRLTQARLLAQAHGLFGVSFAELVAEAARTSNT
jgi:hypothetical protein